MATQAQLSGMRRQLPPGHRPPGAPGLVLPGEDPTGEGGEHGTGQYL
jgi:hypothetical protein